LVVAQLGLRGRIDSELNRQQHFPTGSLITAFQSSQTFQMLLLERLNAWPDVLADLKRIDGFSEPAAERRAIQTLRAWERVRLHIEHRIPRNLATADDPQIALAQMTEKMGELQRTLEAQENDMRSRSSGLANGITARQRSAKSLVVRLNRELEQVSFGSIRGLQIMLSFPEDMAKMLSCLRQENSLSLFDSHLPLEETLARLYQRETGGTIQGARLFDYRNYLRMRLEVRRINGKWEATSDVSTGEAIGTGAAVLVMILRTWNEEAHRISGSAGYAIQQILLDEANRLDEKALDTLSEFCHRMDVQALVAAPGLEKPRRSTVFQLSRSMRGKDEFVTIRGTRITE
jgi:chromosome partition protein MukB